MLPITDRGLQYGDGVFETIAVINQKPILWQQHLRRLIEGCKRLAIPLMDLDVLEKDVTQVCSETKTNQVLKIIITRGSGGRGYQAPENPQPTRLISLYPWPNYPKENTNLGVQLEFSNTILSTNPQLAGIKHLNRLEQVLASQQLRNTTITDAIMCDYSNNIIEGTKSNIFFVQDNILLTPSIDSCGVAGIIRGVILEIAQALQIPAKVTNISKDSVFSVQECFICNSVIGIWPVKQIEQQKYKVGPMTKTLQQSVMKFYD